MPWRHIILELMQAEAIAKDLQQNGKKEPEGTTEDIEKRTWSDASGLDSGANTPQQQPSPVAATERRDECTSSDVTSPPGPPVQRIAAETV
ncbi:hypothetical protein T484DRAFT_1847358 [Baffinella frigidus]|nr:hypothetical protein T484DRAFT_1847358 [Cryptophyta sp. CCMP2293]